jgi:CheY-like chemotaxis protein
MSSAKSTSSAAPRPPADAGSGELAVLVYSDDATTRQRVLLALGRRVAADLPPLRFVEVATESAVLKQVRSGDIDLAILDGEATPVGGIGLCRTLKDEVFQAPPVMVVLGRPQDDWLAAWSRADGVAAHPIDPAALAAATERLVRTFVPAVGADVAVRG